jgi:hypothetical protein
MAWRNIEIDQLTASEFMARDSAVERGQLRATASVRSDEATSADTDASGHRFRHQRQLRTSRATFSRRRKARLPPGSPQPRARTP